MFNIKIYPIVVRKFNDPVLVNALMHGDFKQAISPLSILFGESYDLALSVYRSLSKSRVDFSLVLKPEYAAGMLSWFTISEIAIDSQTHSDYDKFLYRLTWESEKTMRSEWERVVHSRVQNGIKLGFVDFLNWQEFQKIKLFA